jgi:probable O-glycosylation ligase (exosortase A-associated)
MRDLVIMGLTAVMIVLSMRSAFNAMLLWGWSGLMSLDFYLYGSMRGFPYGTAFAGLALALLAIQNKTLHYRYGRGGLTAVWLLMMVHGWCCAAFAFPDLARNAEYALNVSKLILFCLLLPAVLTTPTRLHALLFALCLGVGIHGIIEALKFLSSAGAHVVLGLPKYGDNNYIAVAMAMVIPLVVQIKRYSGSRMVKSICNASVVLLVISVVATYSRGGLISLVALALFTIVNSRRKMAGLAWLALAAALLLGFAPERWEMRMDTIGTAREDSSFEGRLAAWQVSSSIALQDPFFGGGYHAVESPQVWRKFSGRKGLLDAFNIPVLPDSAAGKAAHSIFFEVLGDKGFVGLGIQLWVYLLAFVYARRLVVRARLGGAPWRWAHDFALACSGSLLVYLVGGAGLSMAYFDLPYVLATALMVAHRMLADTPLPVAST